MKKIKIKIRNKKKDLSNEEKSKSKSKMTNIKPTIKPIEPYLTTTIIQINRDNFQGEELSKAAQIIQEGGLVCFPTETVYGLGADAFNPNALNQIFKVKGRPNDNPLICHISDLTMLKRLTRHINENAEKLMKRFWPGALTIIFPKANEVPREVTAGLDTVGVRMPSHPIAFEFIKQCQTPIAAPSANLSTKPSPTIGRHCIEDLNGRIEMIIDGGNCDIGVESTVLLLGDDHPIILRPGGVTLEMLQEIIPSTTTYKISTNLELENKPPTPGMKYRHYAPSVDTIVIIGEKKKEMIFDLTSKYLTDGKKVGVVAWSISQIHSTFFIKIDGDKYKGMAQHLFCSLRDLDGKVDIILIEGVEEIKEGLAVMNRAKKAAVQVIEAN